MIHIHSNCISDTDTDTSPWMYHDTWYLILILYQDTYHDTCITDTPQHWITVTISIDHWLCKVHLQRISLSVTLISTFIIIIIIIIIIISCSHWGGGARSPCPLPTSPPAQCPHQGFHWGTPKGGQVFPSHYPSARSCRTTNTESLCCKTIEVCVPNQLKPPFSRPYNVSGRFVSIVCFAGNFSWTLTLTPTVMSLSPMFAMFDFVFWSSTVWYTRV